MSTPPPADPLDTLSTGMRVVVRHRLSAGQADALGVSLTDALGELVVMDDDVLVVRTRRGDQQISRSAVVAAKEVPPAPVRRKAPHSSVSVVDLQRLMAQGWPAPDTEQLGGWLLRAGGGWTRRANSVLPLGDPGTSRGAAVDRATRWYAERGLPPLFAVFGPPDFSVRDDALGVELTARGLVEEGRTRVLTASVERLCAATDFASEHPHVVMSSALKPAWLADLVERRPGPQEVMTQILTGSPEQLFASVVDGDVTVAVARVAFAQAWAGVWAVHVLPSHRRRGLAASLMVAAGEASRRRGIRSVYVQVERGNDAAQALYDRLAFAIHHDTTYLRY